MRVRAFPPAPGPLLGRGSIVSGAAVTAVLGYAIALWFARVASYAERVEEEEYCAPAVPAPRSRSGQRPLAGRGAVS